LKLVLEGEDLSLSLRVLMFDLDLLLLYISLRLVMLFLMMSLLKVSLSLSLWALLEFKDSVLWRDIVELLFHFTEFSLSSELIVKIDTPKVVPNLSVKSKPVVIEFSVR